MVTMKWRRLSSIIIVLLMLLPAVTTATSLHSDFTAKKVGKKELTQNKGGVVRKTPIPPENVTVIVDIDRIRCLTGEETTPKFYFKVKINGENAVWWEQTFTGKDVYIEWPVAARTLPYDVEQSVDIQIELWEKNRLGFDKPCDISPGKSESSLPITEAEKLTLTYDLKRGEWSGDDSLHDPTGYGHASGYEDLTYDERDYEIWFDVYQLTGDGWFGSYSRLTWWEKYHVYDLNPDESFDSVDFDDDGVPSWWEDKYGYDPLVSESHDTLDPDEDGLTNQQEYDTSQWLSNPFAQDIFIEVDFMEPKNRFSEVYAFPKESQYLVCNAFAKHNITVHIDDGAMGGGGDRIPFDREMDGHDLMAARWKYFLEGEPHHWRRGVFHYAVICHQIEYSARPAGGRMFYIDSHTIDGQYVRDWAPMFKLQGSGYITGFASVFMHELGHTLGLSRFEGIDNEKSRFPWNKEYWMWGSYRSCMNYRYVYKLVDYSNGDDEEYDQDDWETIDLTRFTQRGW